MTVIKAQENDARLKTLTLAVTCAVRVIDKQSNSSITSLSDANSKITY